MGEDFGEAGGWRDEFSGGIGAQDSVDRSRADAIRAQQIDHEPFWSQHLFHAAETRFKGFSGPVGSGKSKALVAEALRLAYDNPGCMGLIGAPTYPMLRDVTRAAFLELLESNRVPHAFKASDNAVHLSEPDSLVIFRSLDKPERLVGTNLAWFGVDELSYCKEDAWRRLEARLRHPKAGRLCGFAVWTPKGYDWVYGRFVGPDRIDGYSAVFARPGENTKLPPDFYERLKKSYDKRFYRQEVLGEYLNIFAGQAYYAFDRTLNVAPVEFNPRLPLCWTMDFNVNPMAALLCQRGADWCNVLQEIVLPNSNTRSACEAFHERAGAYLSAMRAADAAAGGWRTIKLSVEVYGDPAGTQRRSSADESDWQIVRGFLRDRSADYEETFSVASSHPAIKARVNAMNGMLLNESGERRLLVNPACKELIADLEQVAWKTDAAGNGTGELDKSNPKRTHASDGLGYLIEKEFGYRITGGYGVGNLGV